MSLPNIICNIWFFSLIGIGHCTWIWYGSYKFIDIIVNVSISYGFLYYFLHYLKGHTFQFLQIGKKYHSKLIYWSYYQLICKNLSCKGRVMEWGWFCPNSMGQKHKDNLTCPFWLQGNEGQSGYRKKAL